MKAVVYETFGSRPEIRDVPVPDPETHGVVIEVGATGVCRSDWHGWKGHDPDITLPHVPGHELAGTVVAVGNSVKHFKAGDRVTMPFVCGCGSCLQCVSGNQQVCDHQFQPGFTHWGSFAEYVGIHKADLNLVSLPEGLDFAAAASLGCRFVTSFRAVVDQGRVKAGNWVAVFGCGGVGLSAVMISSAIGANVVAVDVSEGALNLARSLGAAVVVNAGRSTDVIGEVRELTRGGAHVSIDALGSPATCFNSVSSLRKRGKHIQVGLIAEGDCAVPMSKVIANELEIIGSHGIQAYRYEELFRLIESGRLEPGKLIGKRISLEESIDVLMNMANSPAAGVTVITEF